MFEDAYPALPCKDCQNADQCARERECYLWRCANPTAPRPEYDDPVLDNVIAAARSWA